MLQRSSHARCRCGWTTKSTKQRPPSIKPPIDSNGSSVRFLSPVPGRHGAQAIIPDPSRRVGAAQTHSSRSISTDFRYTVRVILPHAARCRRTIRNSTNAVSACLLEATARKPGNVHPAASFADLTYADFVRSAHVIRPSFEHGAEWSVGRIVFDAVERTQRCRSEYEFGDSAPAVPNGCRSCRRGTTVCDGIGDVLARADSRRRRGSSMRRFAWQIRVDWVR